MQLVKIIPHTIAIFCLSLGMVYTSYAQQTAGVNEKIAIMPHQLELATKVDTGAKNSSLDARQIEFFEKNDQRWVRFTVLRATNKKSATLEYPLKKTIRIVARTAIEHDAPGRPYQTRPVVDMLVCVGGVQKMIEVNLTDRSNFVFPFLLGETAIAKFDLIVDVKNNYTLSHNCAVN